MDVTFFVVVNGRLMEVVYIVVATDSDRIESM